MKYYEYIFQCEKLPTKHTLHSLVTNFFGKENLNNINYNVCLEGRLIKIKTDQSMNENFEIDFYNKKSQKFTCKLYKKIKKETLEYQEGTEYILTGNIEYGVNITGRKGKKCPIYLGKFESQDLKNKFKENIERQFGVKVPSMKNIYFNRMPSEILENHIQFNNIINLSIPLIILDVEKFKKQEFSSYFQKRSYGFGSLEIN